MIAIINSSLTTVAAYFRMFSYDVAWSGDILIPPAQVVAAQFGTFSGLLDVILSQAQRGEREFLLASHGNPLGLPIPLHSGTGTTANHDLLDLLTGAASGQSNARTQLLQTVSNNNNQRIFADVQVLDRMLTKISAVQALGIQSVHFRACNLAAGPALRAIHRVLGSSHTEAPKVLFVWSNIVTAGVHSTEAQLQRQIGGLGFPQRVFSRADCFLPSAGGADSDPAVAMSVVIGANGRPTALNFRALGAEAIEGWTHNYLFSSASWACGVRPPGGGYRRGGQLPVLGLFNSNAGFPILFPGDSFSYLENLGVENA